MPFGDEVLVFKVMGKMFALTDMTEFSRISLKADPEQAAEQRERYEAVIPAYHMNKKHWNTIVLDGSLPERLIWQWIDDSYHLVIAGLTKKQKSALEKL